MQQVEARTGTKLREGKRNWLAYVVESHKGANTKRNDIVTYRLRDVIPNNGPVEKSG